VPLGAPSDMSGIDLTAVNAALAAVVGGGGGDIVI
jgi:hypothetical protein